MAGDDGNNTLTASGSGPQAMFGYGGADNIAGGPGNDFVYGGAGNDILRGACGDDVIYGGGGDDALFGNAGADTLHGGSGTNVFVYQSAHDSPYRPGGLDEIKDFKPGQDELRFEGMRYGSFDYLGSDPFTGSGNSEARFEAGVLYVDTMGTGVPDMAIEMNAAPTGTDFVWT